MTGSILPFDELNAFSDSIRYRYGQEKLKPEDEEDIIDEMLDLFLLAYTQGMSVTEANLSATPELLTERPIEDIMADTNITVDDVMKVINEKVAGKTWRERTEDYFANGGSVDDIVRIVETEAHRIANTSALAAAKKAGATSKTWLTMMDDRVREQHDWLEGVTVGIDDDFITFDGDRAQAPGMFGMAENNVNCRCELVFE